jgi:putative ABC transport system ATP-binding protein
MLKLENITKTFNNRFKPVLNKISLTLEEGEFCIVLGSNGSGKSTLLRSISGEYRIDSGSINSANLNIASVTQDVNKGTIPELTLLENICLSSNSSKSNIFQFYRNKREKAYDLLKELKIGLEKFIDLPLSSLSGGQRQMTATLMAMYTGPDILLLDEHTSALDPKNQKLLMEYTAQNIAKHNITTLMVTHKLEDAINYGNRIIMLHDGQIVFDIKDKKKQKLSIDQLLELFHSYEDLGLKGESC